MEPIQNDTTETQWIEAHTSDGTPLILEGVLGDTVIVRQVDPTDGIPQRIQLDPGQHIEVCNAISHVSINQSGDPDADDMLFSVRVLPNGRDGLTSIGRTLRHGEVDDGRRVHVWPNGGFSLPPGSFVAELNAIDDFYREVDPDRPEGSLAAALRVWFRINEDDSPEIQRLATSAAHRLDAAAHLLRRADIVRELLQTEGGVVGPQLIVKIDELIHLTQEGIVALGRCIALINKGRALSAFNIPADSTIAAVADTIKDVRDAYEHIDERAVGNLRDKVPDERALMIFDHGPLMRDNQIRYLDHVLDVTELPAVLAACRASIKRLAGAQH